MCLEKCLFAMEAGWEGNQMQEMKWLGETKKPWEEGAVLAWLTLYPPPRRSTLSSPLSHQLDNVRRFDVVSSVRGHPEAFLRLGHTTMAVTLSFDCDRWVYETTYTSLT
jgi:hypothetical protein